MTALGLASSVLAEDITAAVRKAGAATFGLTGGTEYNAIPISRAFRVGTSATLPRSVLKKFSVANKGLRVVQDEDGYLKTALPPGLMLLFR